jgi:sugar transferase (PEP-CTERM/EpsH1 system associated)
MSRLLMLAHRLPYPPNKGDKIRAFNVLAHLSRRHEVWLATLVDDPADLAHVGALRRHAAQVATARIDGRLRRAASLRALWPARSLSVAHFHDAGLQSTVDGWLDTTRFDGVMCSSAPMAEYLFASRHRDGALRGVTRVMDLIDVDSVKWSQYAETAPPWRAWLYRHEARELGAYEHRIVREFDRVFLVSEAEARMLGGDDPQHRVGAFGNGVDLDYFAPREDTARDGALLVFTGVMDYPPNEEAVEWFARRVLPVVREHCPDVRFAIVGSRPSAAVRRLAGLPGVIVTGFVDDVRDWIARSSLCVAPLRIARGIQNKVLEAMAMARAVVATPQAFEGIDAEPGRELVVARDERGFADAVLALLREPERASSIGAAARARVERRYRWDVNLSVLDEVFP